MLHRSHVFFHALPRMLSLWKSMCPHHTELFFSTEQQTKFLSLVAEVPAEGLLLLSM